MLSTSEQSLNTLRIRLLGGFGVSVGSRGIEDSEWRLRKARTLVKLLALAPGHRLHREQVMDALWPDLGVDAARNNLHHVLYAARRVLDPARGSASQYLQLVDDQLTLGPAGSVEVDVDAFEAAVAAARHARDPDRYRRALALYGGELLPEDRYEDWASIRREELRSLHLQLFVELSACHAERGELGAAIEDLRRAVALEPVFEEAHAALMRLYAQAGQRNQALRQFELLREALDRDLGAEPEPATSHLYSKIRAGSFPESERAAGYPPVTPVSPRHNLPAPLTSFIGREREQAELMRLLGTTRLLSLIATGGSGKTRLALEVAQGVIAEYPDGVWFVELAATLDPRLVPRAVADALQVREQPTVPLTDTLIHALRDRQLLLVLDNCEHLIDACAALAADLLRACPHLRMLATSREPLGVPGELTWRAPRLSVPSSYGGLTPETLAGYESIRLFIERARYRQPSFALAAENSSLVAEICARLDGLPLAIELAAARVGMLSVEQITSMLDDSLRLLAGGGRVVAPRHQTIRGMLDWSVNMLDERERRLLRRLSVFSGGWTFEAAQAISDEEPDTLDLLSQLIDKSLVLADAGPGGSVRYRMLEPTRQYAAERLEESEESGATRRRHAALYLTLAEAAETELRGPHWASWVERLEIEQDNLRTALSWSLDEEPEMALRLVGALGGFWYRHGHVTEGRGWLEAALAKGTRSDSIAWAKALHNAAVLVAAAGDNDRAVVLFEQELALSRALKLPDRIASALNSLGTMLNFHGDVSRARALLEESLALRRELGDKEYITSPLSNLALLEWSQGDLPRAQALFREALILDREAGYEWGIAVNILNQGGIAWDLGEFERSRELFVEGLSLTLRVGDMGAVASALEGLAAAVAQLGDATRAGRLWGAAEALRDQINVPVPPDELSLHGRMLVATRARLAGSEWEAALEEGRSMTLDRAVQSATSQGAPASPTPEGSATLTRREREIAGLLAQGLTNRRIAEQLDLSERTVEAHVARILKKLGLSSRAQLAGRATEHGQREN